MLLCYLPGWSNISVFVIQLLFFLFLLSMLMYSLCLRSLTTLIPQTTDLLFYFLVFLKLLKLSLTGKILSIYHNLVSDSQYRFRKIRSTGYLLVFVSDSWSSSPSCFGETFAVALDISKAFDRVWHKSLLSKLLSYGFYPSLRTFISNFFSGRSVSAVVDSQCSKLKSINSGVPH